jgi:hypothetical protein
MINRLFLRINLTSRLADATLQRSYIPSRKPSTRGNQVKSLLFGTSAIQNNHGSLEATIIQEQLQARNLNNWGFAIYRCTYGSDEEWRHFVEIIKTQAGNAIVNACGAPELYQKLSWTVMEDRSLEDATTEQVRATFRNWIFSTQAESEIPASLQQPRNISLPFRSPEEEKFASRAIIAPRYRYCIQIDHVSLNSILKHDKDEESLGYRGHVNLIKLDWEIPNPSDSGAQGCRRSGLQSFRRRRTTNRRVPIA